MISTLSKKLATVRFEMGEEVPALHLRKSAATLGSLLSPEAILLRGCDSLPGPGRSLPEDSRVPPPACPPACWRLGAPQRMRCSPEVREGRWQSSWSPRHS